MAGGEDADAARATATDHVGLVRIVLTVFLPFSGGYFLSYLYRTINSQIAEPLTRELGLSAGDLGLLTSAYLFAFAAFQVPLGVLLDRFGPRRVQSVLLLAAALGALVFSVGETAMELTAGRALIGLGVAGGLMASFKAITLWFPKERWPLVNGCFMGIGGLGATAATAPVQALLQVTDWRGIFTGLSIATVLASILIFVLVPEKPAAARPEPLRKQVLGIAHIYRDRLFWSLAPMAMTSLAAGMALQGLWAGPWLRDIAGFDPRGTTYANALLGLNLALTAGFVLGGAIADALVRLGLRLTQVIGGGVVLFCLSQAAIILEADPTGVAVWLAFGFLSNVAVFAFPVLSGHFPLKFSGRANTGLNVLIFSGAFLAQYAIGAIIDLWPPAPGGGYLPEAYRAAFGVVLALQVAGFLWFVLARRGK